MKSFKSIQILFLLFFTISVFGQKVRSKITVHSSPKGVYIKIVDPDELNKLVIGEKKYIVKRKRLDEANFKDVGVMQAANSVSIINAVVNKEDLAEFEKSMNTTIMDFINTRPRYENVALFSEVNIELRQVFGAATVDNSAEKGNFYIYAVYELEGKNEKFFAETGLFHNTSNELLKLVNVELSSIVGMDTSVRFNWNVSYKDAVLPEATLEKQTKLLSNIKNQKASKKNYAEITQFLNNEGKIFSSFDPKGLNSHFNVYYRLNDQSNWTFHSKRLAGTDSLGNLFVSARVLCKSEDLVEMKVVPEDIVYNQGTDSDIARGVAVTNSSVILIYGVDSKDSTNSIVLNWKQLPEKLYYSGIEVSRSFDGQPMKQIAVLPANANSYTDYDIYPAGQIFTYFVSPLFLEKQDLRQELPAMAAQSCTMFSNPLPPYNLEAAMAGDKVKLTWEAINEKSIFSYYVYRGTSPNQFDLVSNSVYKREFIDSLSITSSRQTYYYKIVAMNLKQDTSDYSPTLSYTPEIGPENLYSPDLIDASLINNEIWLKWVDVKLNDNFVEGYQLERQKDGESFFTKMHEGILVDALFLDKTAVEGILYNYRATSVSTNGYLGEYSKVTSFGIPIIEAEINPISNIEAVNLSKAIRVSWPTISTDDIQSYNVYRKAPSDESFEKIGQVESGVFEFEDAEIDADDIYIYSITAVNAKGKESKIVQKKSIYRENVK